MAKGQKRSNREVRKPKADKAKSKALPPIGATQDAKPASQPRKSSGAT